MIHQASKEEEDEEEEDMIHQATNTRRPCLRLTHRMNTCTLRLECKLLLLTLTLTRSLFLRT